MPRIFEQFLPAFATIVLYEIPEWSTRATNHHQKEIVSSSVVRAFAEIGVVLPQKHDLMI
jgi:hypothetical protein